MTAATLYRKLEPLIGHRFDYVGETWILIEILEDIDSIVLRRSADLTPGDVQQTAYGLPGRRVQRTLTLAVSNADGTAYSDDILVLLEGHKKDAR